MEKYRKADIGENYSYYLFTDLTKAGERLEVEITKVEARSKKNVAMVVCKNIRNRQPFRYLRQIQPTVRRFQN